MKKYVAYLILAFAVMLVLPSCENRTGIDFAENTLTLTLSCNNLGLTRATENGDNNLNENTVNSIDCYFYPIGANFNNTPAVLVKDNITALTETTEGTYTANIKFEETELTALFGTVAKGGSAQCLIYVIANRPVNVTLPTGNPTINELKALTITSDFSKSQAQQLFVMDSDATPDSNNDTSVAGDDDTDIDNDDIVIYTIDANGSKSFTATVPLYRTAAKITLSVNRFGPENGGNKVTVDGKTYTPNYGGVYAVLHNGINKSVIAPDVVSRSVASSDFFATESFSMAAQSAPCKLSVPFYSYASDWSESPENAAYITLVVPWKVESENPYTPYYYKVPINYSGDKLERNTHYKIDIAVSILGTLNPDQTVEILPSYTILNWSNDTVETSMSDFRYLMVEKNHYVMNNVNSIEIPYWTSHNCSIVNVSVKRPNLSNGSTETITSGYTLALRNGNIYYERTLNNTFTDANFDFTPYTITFRIQHTTESSSYYEDIEIIQYPAIYGEADRNTFAVNGGGRGQGYVWVNGYQGGDVSGTTPNRYSRSTFKTDHYRGFFDEASGLTLSSGVTSTSMLIFTISSVKGTPYVIGDPREEVVDPDFVGEKHTVNRTEYSIWDYAPGVDGSSSRLLENYYATYTTDKYDAVSTNNIYSNEDEAAAAERTYNMIAPKFRISSGYGQLGLVGENRYYHLMKKRCASYQEDGYPAGRWRLPTKAEFQFIIYLSDQGKIPALFYPSYQYWCAHGHGVPNGATVTMRHRTDNGSSSSISVRCVYDDWYWGSDPVISDTDENDYFIWGDVNRANKADAPAINY